MIVSTINPLVSVIIPGYNHAPYLRERIDSVLKQDYSNFEVILLDDRSADDSASIMLSYKDDVRVNHVIINEHNSGNTFLQWERGILLSKGEYVWIAESDDVAEPQFISRLMQKLLAEPEAVLAFSWSRMIGPDSRDLGYSWDETKRYKEPGVYDGYAFCLHRLVYKNLMYNASMVIFRKQYYYNVASDYQQFRHSGDWLFWFEMCRQGRVCEVPLKLNSFRQHPQKVSNHSRQSGEDFHEMGAIQQSIVEKMGLSAYQRKCLKGRMAKRLKKSSITDTSALIRKFPEVYDGSTIDIWIYTIDKLLNISKLNEG